MINDWNDYRNFYITEVKPYKSYETVLMKATLNNGLEITVRAERVDDIDEVNSLVRRAFWDKKRRGKNGGTGADEHYLCHKFRTTPEFIPELDLVAECEIEGKLYLIGNVLFSTGYVKLPSGEVMPVLIFGPLAVLPEFQRMGVGAALLDRAESLAQNAGWGAIFLYGHPTYYPRLGYREAVEFGVTTHDGKNFPAFMAKELVPGSLSSAHGGAFFYSPVFDEIDKDELRTFDADFPEIHDGEKAKPLSRMHLPYLHMLMNRPETLASVHEIPTDLSVWENAYKNWIKNYEQNFIIYSDENPAGWLKLNGFESNTGWISMLVIDPKYRRRGLGRFAVSFAECIFKENGLRHAAIHTTEDNLPARALYESCGFIVTERGECTNGDGAKRTGLTFEKEI